ncbi:hypothetical protein L3Q67_32510 [Saccharothrix sp. AJ9571]|nr:hypothetical protein L3Q67_32510 [Saccharothrix sp. AJ9571]
MVPARSASELLRFKAEASGAAHRTIRLYEGLRRATVEEIVGAVERGLRDHTRILALIWVHFGLATERSRRLRSGGPMSARSAPSSPATAW